tara:strand:+ start:225 stop:449 length:225 start_codon:yes stop_codon:yes gene_type:complete
MIEVTFVLLLFTGGEAIEYTPYENLSQCLSTRRKIKRNNGMSPNFDERWVCKEMKVKMFQAADGTYHIEELIDG